MNIKHGKSPTKEIFGYIWLNYNLWVNAKDAETLRNLGFNNMQAQNWLTKNNAEEEFSQEPSEQTIKTICLEMLKEYQTRIIWNHCPKCNALTRTIMAKQCPKCFHSWHNINY